MNTLKPLLVVLGLAACLAALAAEVRLPQPGPDDFLMEVPAEWQGSLDTTNPRAANLRLTGKDLQAFAAQVTVIQVLGSNPTPDDAAIRKLVEKTAQALQAQAVEEKLVLEPLNMPGRAGYSFSLTDRAPKPGEYKYMTQGAVAMGRTVISFTVLTNQDTERYKAAVLAMLAAAKFVPGPTEILLAAPKGGPTLALPRGDWQMNQQKQRTDGTGAYYFFSSAATGVNFSVWLEPNKNCSSGETCLALALKNPAYNSMQAQKTVDDAGFKATSFYIDANDKLPVDQLNVLASAYVNGYWVDVHLSQVGRGRPDPAAVLAVLHSLQLH